MTEGEVVTPEWFYQGSTVFKAFRFPITNFGNDGGVDSRLLISGMTENRALDGRPSHILPLTSTQEAREGRRIPFSVRENYKGPGICGPREGSYS